MVRKTCRAKVGGEERYLSKSVGIGHVEKRVEQGNNSQWVMLYGMGMNVCCRIQTVGNWGQGPAAEPLE